MDGSDEKDCGESSLDDLGFTSKGQRSGLKHKVKEVD